MKVDLNALGLAYSDQAKVKLAGVMKGATSVSNGWLASVSYFVRRFGWPSTPMPQTSALRCRESSRGPIVDFQNVATASAVGDKFEWLTANRHLNDISID